MRPLTSTLAFLLLSACSGEWTPADIDGDGYTVATGDCWDNEVGPDGFDSADIHPGAVESWYDGFDQDCAGDNDYDKDGDGHASVAYPDPAGAIPSDDCWDDPDVVPGAFATDDAADQPEASEVYPGAVEAWYDGADQDCVGDDDFDQDGDGFASAANPSASGTGDDCFDAVEDPFANDAGLDPADVNPDAEEAWYDGTDADCAGDDDFDQDGDGYPLGEECDDLDATRFPEPSVPEVWYDGLDDNCDGNDGDQDGDGYYIADYAFELPSAYLPGDCYDDPADAALWAPLNGFAEFGPEAAHPDATDTFYDGLDQDCADGDDFDQDLDGYRTDAYADATGARGDDCDDALASTNPGATESWYDGVDADCAGDDDFDQDHDGYASDTDCDDTSTSISPGALEACGNEVDEDCSGSDNDAGAIGCTPFYTDADADAFGGGASACLCEAEAPYAATVAGDCDDAAPAVNPDGTESCATTADDDCSGSTDAVGALGCTTRYRDADGDAYGTSASQCTCEESGGYSATNDDDCNDASAAIYPGRAEICNDVDDDCDSSVDEGLTLYYADADGDDFGDEAAVGDCVATGLTNNEDCDDSNEMIYPGATDYCDGEANDCTTAGTWTSADENRTVAFVSTGDVWSDVSSTFAATSSESTVVNLESGTYNFCAGTYYTRILASGDTTDIVGIYGADATTLQNGWPSGAVVTVGNGQVLLSGFTVTGGKGGSGFGGGILGNVTSTAPAAPHLEVEDCIVTGNTATRGGGVSSYGNGWIKLVRTTVEGNSATTDGGGIHANGGADVTLEDSIVQDNSATGDGGGIFLDTGTLTMTGSDVLTNTANDDGGGLFINTGTATCSSGGINGNEAIDHGGGVYLSSQSSTTAMFTAASCDFGTGATDNVGEDVTVKTSGYQDYTSYGAGASFVCSNASGICTP